MSSYEVKAGLAEVPGFDVVGLSVVTDTSKATDDINALWEQFFKEQVGLKLADKADDTIIAVYSDYEGDHEAPYRVTIGYRLQSPETPAGLARVRVEDQNYAVMSAGGEQPKALLETWKAIWSGDLPRSFKTDFEVYGPRFFQPGLHEVLVHIGLND